MCRIRCAFKISHVLTLLHSLDLITHSLIHTLTHTRTHIKPTTDFFALHRCFSLFAIIRCTQKKKQPNKTHFISFYWKNERVFQVKKKMKRKKNGTHVLIYQYQTERGEEWRREGEKRHRKYSTQSKNYNVKNSLIYIFLFICPQKWEKKNMPSINQPKIINPQFLFRMHCISVSMQEYLLFILSPDEWLKLLLLAIFNDRNEPKVALHVHNPDQNQWLYRSWCDRCSSTENSREGCSKDWYEGWTCSTNSAHQKMFANKFAWIHIRRRDDFKVTDEKHFEYSPFYAISLSIFFSINDLNQRFT